MPRESNLSENLDLRQANSGGESGQLLGSLLVTPALGDEILEGLSDILDAQKNWQQLYLLDQVIAASSSGVVISDMQLPNQPVIYCNAAFTKITGYKAEEVIGSNCRILQGEDTNPKVVEKIRQCLRLGIHGRVVIKNYRHNGTLFWNELSLSPVRNKRGDLTHFIGIQADITQRIQFEAKLRRSEAQLQEQTAMLDIANNTIIVFDLQGLIKYWNQGAEFLYGWTKAEAIGQNVHDLLQTSGSAPLEQIHDECVQKGHWQGKLQQYQRNGQKIIVSSRWAVQKNPQGHPQAILEINNDITEQQWIEQELRRRDRLLAGVATATNYLLTKNEPGIALKMALKALGEATEISRVYLFEYHIDNATGDSLMVLNERWNYLDDLSPLESNSESNLESNLELKTPCPYPHSPQFPPLASAMGDWWQETMVAGRTISGRVVDLPEPVRSILSQQKICSILIVPIQIQDKCWGFIGFDHGQQEWYCSETEKSILLAAAGTIGGAIARHRIEIELASLNTQLESLVHQRTLDLEIANQNLRQEITTRCHIESQLRHNAYHDYLTGLPNRTLLMEKLYEALYHVQHNPNYLFALLFLDLDRFKVINDSLGHAMGDSLLVAIGATLGRCVRQEKDMVARLGGDEFAIFLDNISDQAESIQVANRIIQELSRPFILQGQEVFTGVSIGIAFSHQGYRQPEDILQDADLVMYRAKSSGRARYEIFDQTINQQIVSTLKLENDLRRAVKSLATKSQFYVEYQPIVSLVDNRILGFEALVRWQHSEQGIISPLTFIPLAEETGLIIPIGEWILQQACEQTAIWHRDFNPHLTINVNLSPRQFARPDLVPRIAKILKDTGLNSQALKLEITESILIDQHNQTIETLQCLKDIDVKLCMDDFGTGYSSLSYLHNFPMDTLKIDQSFIHQMAPGSRHNKIVQTIINLAHNLDMQVVAEGVENQSQLEQLRSLSCECGQGYFFSLPLSSKEVNQLLNHGQLDNGQLDIFKTS